MIDPAALRMVLGVLTGWPDRREREAVAYSFERIGSGLLAKETRFKVAWIRK